MQSGFVFPCNLGNRTRFDFPGFRFVPAGLLYFSQLLLPSIGDEASRSANR